MVERGLLRKSALVVAGFGVVALVAGLVFRAGDRYSESELTYVRDQFNGFAETNGLAYFRKSASGEIIKCQPDRSIAEIDSRRNRVIVSDSKVPDIRDRLHLFGEALFADVDSNVDSAIVVYQGNETIWQSEHRECETPPGRSVSPP